MNLSPKQWVLLTALISGVSVYYNSMAVKGLDPVGFAMAKNMLAALALVGILALSGRFGELVSALRRQPISILSIAVIGGSMPFALFFTGLSIAAGEAGAAGASFIYRLVFVFSAIFAAWMLKERPGIRTWAGVATVLAANLLLLLNLNLFSFGLGGMLVLAATLMWSAENVLLKRALGSMSPDALAAARLGLGSVILFMASAAWALAGPGAGSAFGAGALAGLASLPLLPLLASALFILGFAMTFYRGLAGLGVADATAILTLGGLVSAGLPVLLASRMPGLVEMISLAGVALGVGMILSQKSAMHSKPSAVADTLKA